ncbi:MAG: hypothetical protein K2X43_02155 [Hyphomonadaceae bacterium]|nr:hypothetical protein [Hyphomonadaceae bacterium]
MSKVAIVRDPALTGKRRQPVLAEDRLLHYPEFRQFFARTFDLDRIGLAQPGYVSAPSGMVYVLMFVGRSGEPFPAGLEVHVMADALEPVDEQMVDRDLWAILGWMIAGVGPPWSVADLAETGRLYRLPVAQ